MNRIELLFTVLVSVSLLAVGVSCDIPSNQFDACELTANGDRGYIHFLSSHTDVETVYLGITEEEYRTSMESLGSREGMSFKTVPDCFVREERAVRIIADYIMEIYPDDYRRARAACYLCQTAIKYTEDIDLYGTVEYWARPTETLYNLKGDCEDTAVLFCSICLCMDIPTVLLDSPHHVGSAVRVNAFGLEYYIVDGERYYSAVTSSSSSTLFELGETSDMPMTVYERSSDYLYYLVSYYKLVGDKVMRWL